MTWGLKKYCSFLSCCSADDAMRPLIQRVNRSMRARSRPPTQKQGLLELLSSYQLAKNERNSNMKEWALQWAQSGTLLRLAKIAVRLGKRAEASSMDLVCLNSALIVAYLPEETSHICDLLVQFWRCFSSPRKHSPFGVYRLLLVLMRIEPFRKKMTESGFVKQLQNQYQTLTSGARCFSRKPDNEMSTTEGSEDEASSSDEEIIDDLLNEQPDGIQQSAQSSVPRLNLSWLKNVPTHESVPRQPEPSLSIERSARTEGETTISDRSAPGISNRSYTIERCATESTQLDGGSLSKVKSLLWRKRKEVDDMNGMGHVLHTLGLSETITLLGNLNDTYFMEKYDILPLQDWNLKPFLSEKESSVHYREKLAILEIFLCLTPSLREAVSSTSLLKTVSSDIFLSIQRNNIQENFLQHCLAVYIEFSTPMCQEDICRDLQYVKLQRDATQREKGDPLLETLVKEINKTTCLRRPGDGTFHKLYLLLMVASEYFRLSPDPMKIANTLIFALESLQRTFIKSADQVLHWGEAHLRAFSSLLSFYESIFKKCKSLKDWTIVEQLVTQTMKEEWMRLLENLSEGVLFNNPFKWLPQNEKYDLLMKTLTFFTSLMVSLDHLSTAKPFTQSRHLDDFNFLLTPGGGLVSSIIHSNEMDSCLREQVLKVLMVSCSLTRSSFGTDSMVIEAHLKSLLQQFLEFLYGMSTENKEQTSILALQLQVITTMMSCGSSAAVTHVLSSGLPELLIHEIRELTCETASPLCMHLNECYSHSKHPSFAEESLKNHIVHHTDPVEILRSSSSSDSENEENPMLPTFNLGFSFLERKNTTEGTVSARSASTGVSIFSPTTRTRPEEVTENSTGQLFCEGPSIEQLDSELFGRDSDDTSVENDEIEEEEWPSDLSVHGDINEDGRRWEKYITERDFKNGKISFEEMNKRIAALTTPTTTTDEEIEEAAHAVSSFPVPVLNFERLKSSLSDATSVPVSGQTTNPPYDESPSMSNPPRPSAECEKQPLSSAASPFDLSPGHQQKPSIQSCGFDVEATRRLVHDDEMHLAAVEFLMELLLGLDGYDGQTSVETSDLVASMSSALFHDVNGSHFTDLVPQLIARTQKRGPKAIRMLRLLLEELFEVDQYITLDRIYKGEVAQVKRCMLKRSGKDIPTTCVVKVIDSPREYLRSDASILNIYSEVSLMERVSREPGFCQIYDFGVRSDSAYIVMQDCQCSLKDWIGQFPVSSPGAIRLILNIFTSIAKSVHRLHQKVIVHFDLKCSNILLKGGSTDAGFWFPETEIPEFEILLADFGVARCYEGQDFLGTVRNRGTEYSKAPEMLLITNTQKRDVPNYDRRRMKGAGSPSDVWALGCLLFELLTGEILHFDADWARFYTRVTQDMMPLIGEDKIKMLNPRYRTEILDLLQFILVRDPQWRPSVSAIIHKVEQLMERDVLPDYTPEHFHHIPQMSSHAFTPPEAHESIPQSEWLTRIISSDASFSLNLSKLRLSVSVLERNMHSPAFHDLMERLTSPSNLGVIYVDDSVACDGNVPSQGFRSRIKVFCSRKQTEAFFLSTSKLKDGALLSEISRSIHMWCKFKGSDCSLSLCTVRGCEVPFFEFLLDVIMFMEECPCLKAISILKERVKGG